MSVSEIAISELGRIVTGKTPSTSNAAFFDGEYQFVTPTDLDWKTYYCRTTERTVTDDAKKAHRNQFISAGTVMVTCIGNTIGKCGISSDDCLTNQQINSIIPDEGVNPEFVYYLLVQNTGLVRGVGLGGGSATPILNKTIFSNIKLRVPPRRSWDAIAATLSAYDDLIENNRRRIQLLEQAARLLYKEWFVHLRFPGHEHVKIKDGVPEGWVKGVVADFYATASGGTPSRKNPDFYVGDIPWVKTQELTGGFILSSDERITEEAIKFSSAKLFPRHTVLVAMYGATIGQIAMLSVPSTTNQACCAVIPAAPGTTFAHAYLFLSHHKADLIGLGQGAAQKNISQQVIKAVKMILPTKALLDAFAESVCPFFDQIELLQKMNINLEKARDLLLPRLMNGEVAV